MTRMTLIAALALATVATPALAQRSSPQPPPAALKAPTAQDWRTPDAADVMVIDTNKGRIFVELAPRLAPAHVERIKILTRRGFYDGRSFFRVIDVFMAQTGDPLDSGAGGSELPDLSAEFTFRRGAADPFVPVADAGASQTGFVGVVPVMTQSPMLMAMTADQRITGWALFCPGVAGMARGSEENSANSQFFLMRQAYPSLEKRYTAFGRVVAGLEVVRAIKTGEPVAAPQDQMTRVRMLADIPGAERPALRVVDTAGPWFAAQVAQMRAEDGADFSACNLKIPSEVK
ncbi:MAG: peptidylprolyl isomerase [Phenylobacterium sp.]|uniref:peptidylprolyl isomerase n=1 Tax=Phenylobacterium sp. TaxID=1871053 RepID=UPI0027254C4F|nr:peptidylprolyl isomerase [Phenylobacterium sp.]MDO8900928.1 peptidylprolyl isomerase [Phenylobacterium sp.]